MMLCFQRDLDARSAAAGGAVFAIDRPCRHTAMAAPRAAWPARPVLLAALAALALALAGLGAGAQWGGASVAERPPAARTIDCDCGAIQAGLRTMQAMRRCRDRQAALYSQLGRGTFALEDRGGVVAGGSVCLPDAAGPAAWPVQGAPLSAWRG